MCSKRVPPSCVRRPPSGRPTRHGESSSSLPARSVGPLSTPSATPRPPTIRSSPAGSRWGCRWRAGGLTARLRRSEVRHERVLTERRQDPCRDNWERSQFTGPPRPRRQGSRITGRDGWGRRARRRSHRGRCSERRPVARLRWRRLERHHRAPRLRCAAALRPPVHDDRPRDVDQVDGRAPRSRTGGPRALHGREPRGARDSGEDRRCGPVAPSRERADDERPGDRRPHGARHRRRPRAPDQRDQRDRRGARRSMGRRLCHRRPPRRDGRARCDRDRGFRQRLLGVRRVGRDRRVARARRGGQGHPRRARSTAQRARREGGRVDLQRGADLPRMGHHEAQGRPFRRAAAPPDRLHRARLEQPATPRSRGADRSARRSPRRVARARVDPHPRAGEDPEAPGRGPGGFPVRRCQHGADRRRRRTAGPKSAHERREDRHGLPAWMCRRDERRHPRRRQPEQVLARDVRGRRAPRWWRALGRRLVGRGGTRRADRGRPGDLRLAGHRGGAPTGARAARGASFLSRR